MAPALPHNFLKEYSQLPRNLSTHDLTDVIAVAGNHQFLAGTKEKSKRPDGFTRTPLYSAGEEQKIGNGFSLVTFSRTHPTYPGQVWYNRTQFLALLARPLPQPCITATVRPLHAAAGYVAKLVESHLSPLDITKQAFSETIAHLRLIIPAVIPGCDSPGLVNRVLLDVDNRLVNVSNTYVSAVRSRARDDARDGLSDPVHTQAVYDQARRDGFVGYYHPLELTSDGHTALSTGARGAALSGFVATHLQLCLMSPLGIALMHLYGRVHVHLDGCYNLVDHRYAVFSLAVAGTAALASFTVATLVTSDESHEAILAMLKFVFTTVGFVPLHVMADMGLAEIKAIEAAGCHWALCMFHMKQALVVYFLSNMGTERNTFLRLLNIAQASDTFETFNEALAALNSFVDRWCPPKLRKLWRDRYSTPEFVRAWASIYRPLMHPLVFTDMPLEAIFGVYKNSLSLKGGRIGDFAKALTSSVYEYEILKLTRFIVQVQRPGSTVSANVRAGARMLLKLNLLSFDGQRFVTVPSCPGEEDVIFFSDLLQSTELQVAALLELLRPGGLPFRASARGGVTSASLLADVTLVVTRVTSIAGELLVILSAVVEAESPVLTGVHALLEGLQAQQVILLSLSLDALRASHAAVDVAVTAIPVVIEALKELVDKGPRVIASLRGGPVADVSYSVDLLTSTCTCPASKHLPALGRLCKQLLAVSLSKTLTENVFDGLVRIVGSNYNRDGWRHCLVKNAWVADLSGHIVTCVGDGVFICDCNYMRLALGRYCHFPLCPALAFLMIGPSEDGWGRSTLGHCGTELGTLLEKERNKRMLSVGMPPPPSSIGEASESEQAEKTGTEMSFFCAVRDSAGRKGK